MSTNEKRFDAGSEIREYFLSAIQKVTGLIPDIKEEAELKSKLAEVEKIEKIIEKEIKSLKVSIKLVEKDEIRKAIEEIVSLKEQELKENDEKHNKLSAQLDECTEEISDYSVYIARIFDFTDEFDMINEDEIEYDKFSQNEFIAYVFLRTNFGEYNFPRYRKDDISTEINKVLRCFRNNDWDSFIEWVVKN